MEIEEDKYLGLSLPSAYFQLTRAVTRYPTVTGLLSLPIVVWSQQFLKKAVLHYRVHFSLQHNLHSICIYILPRLMSLHFCQTFVYISLEFVLVPSLPSFKLLSMFIEKKQNKSLFTTKLIQVIAFWCCFVWFGWLVFVCFYHFFMFYLFLMYKIKDLRPKPYSPHLLFLISAMWSIWLMSMHL